MRWGCRYSDIAFEISGEQFAEYRICISLQINRLCKRERLSGRSRLLLCFRFPNPKGKDAVVCKVKLPESEKRCDNDPIAYEEDDEIQF